MLLWIKQSLNIAGDEDDLRLWVAVVTAFHFMLRSIDYCARLERGKFNMDQVVRVCDLIFKRGGKQIFASFRSADEVMLVLGRGKTTEGGEVRSHFKSNGSPLCVVLALAELAERIDMSDRQRPLFAWKVGSRRNGEGVRHCDVMRIIQGAAEGCGRDTKLFGTHSLRRGGAASYLLAGQSIESVALFGRWANTQTVRGYIEPAARTLMKGYQDRVNHGFEDPCIILKEKPRERDMQLFRARRRAMAANE